MPTALHLFDASIAPSALEQLRGVRTRRPGDRLVRVGPSQERTDLPAPDDTLLSRLGMWPAITRGQRMSFDPAIRRLRARAGGVELVHCWVAGLASTAAAGGAPTLVSLFRPPDRAELRSLRPAIELGARLLPASDALADALAGLGLPRDRMSVLPPAAALADRSPRARAEARRRLGLADDHWVLLAPAQAWRGKGPFWSLWGMGILRYVTDKVRLVVCGAGPAVEHVRSIARKVGFAGETLIAPADPPDDPWAAADVCLLCEPDGYGAAELARAVRAQLPVIAADAGELASLLAHDRTALLAAPGKARSIAESLWRLHSHPEQAAVLARNAADELSARFDPAAKDAALERLYATARG